MGKGTKNIHGEVKAPSYDDEHGLKTLFYRLFENSVKFGKYALRKHDRQHV